ncbi:MAG: thioredoxin [Deltaproteobacteria bacterium]|nr:thioredoxin [Deltaproteobacteria bacterium]
MSSENVVILSDADFEEKVLKSGAPVLVDFWAEWCGPCKMIAPFLEELAGEYKGKLTIGKLNVDDNSQYASQYGVRSIPTLILFKNGEQVDMVVGADTGKIKKIVSGLEL